MIFRAARHTSKLQAITEFYTAVLGFSVLGSFEGHQQYDGVFLGKPHLDWHLEFTTSKSSVKHSSDADDLMVFYPTDRKEYDAILDTIQKEGIETLEPENPYWRINGTMIRDPDDFRIIISHQKIRDPRAQQQQQQQ